MHSVKLVKLKCPVIAVNSSNNCKNYLNDGAACDVTATCVCVCFSRTSHCCQWQLETRSGFLCQV